MNIGLKSLKKEKKEREDKYPLLIDDDDIYVLFLNEETRSCSTCPFRGFCGR